MEHQYVQILIDFLRQNPHWGGLIACAIAFIESFPVLGSIVPGTVTMTMVGAAMGSGILPIPSTLLWTLSGALTGDSTGYLIGRYYQDRITNIWPFARYPHWLSAGRLFFAKHGGKSIFMGFYMGPIRSMVPLTAGMLNFPSGRFFAAIIPSACVWAVLYSLPGFLLGRFSLTLPPKAATKFILFALLGVLLLWALVWCINHVFNKVWALIDRGFYKCWIYFYSRPRFHGFSSFLEDKQNPHDHYQLLRLFFIVLLFSLFIAVTCNVLAKGAMTHCNEPVYFLLRSLRTHILTPSMIAITLFSDKRVMWAASAFITLWCLQKKYYRSAAYVLGLVLSTTTTIFLLKQKIPSMRPPEPNFSVVTNSFPSGHTTLSIALLIFLSALISSALPVARKKIPFYCTSLIIVLIALSRLYLGAHWLSDIVASLLLAVAFALTALLLYFRQARPTIPPIKLLTVAVLSLGVSWAANSIYAYKNIAKNYVHIDLPTVAIEDNKWWTQPQQFIPRYREDRFGQSVQAFNLQWAGSLEDLKKTLIDQGWQDHSSDASFSATLSAIANKSPLRYLSLFPRLYQNRSPAASLSLGEKSPFLVVQLWECNLILNNHLLKNNTPLWLGAIYYYPLPRKSKAQLNTLAPLMPFLKNYPHKLITIPQSSQPLEIQKTNWDGRILLVKPN